MPDIRTLYDLQAIDLELDRRRKRLAEIGKALGNEQPLAPFRAAASQAKQQLAQAEARQRNLDHEIAEFSERMKQAEQKLYSGAVTASKELLSLQADVEQVGRQRGEREEQLIGVLDEVEAARKHHAEAAERLARAEQAWRGAQDEMTRERAVLDAEVPQLTAQRQERAGQVSPTDLNIYDQVRKTHGGRAVARVRNGVCESCRMSLPTSRVQTLRTTAAPVRCPNCGLVLFAD
ncbi:MAG: hypothetical protein FJ318_10250 [SAR202 cluster bacterium]|nr:hypothetical protein [SAR202 cluster bacterium]